MCLSFSSNNTVWTDRLTIILVVKLQRSVIVIRAPNSCFSAEIYHKQNHQYEQIKAPSIHDHCFIKKNNEQFLTFFLQQVREHVSSKQLNMNAPRKKKKHTWFLITQSFKENRKDYISVIRGSSYGSRCTEFSQWVNDQLNCVFMLSLTSVSIFSKLISIHCLWYWQGEFV